VPVTYNCPTVFEVSVNGRKTFNDKKAICYRTGAQTEDPRNRAFVSKMVCEVFYLQTEKHH